MEIRLWVARFGANKKPKGLLRIKRRFYKVRQPSVSLCSQTSTWLEKSNKISRGNYWRQLAGILRLDRTHQGEINGSLLLLWRRKWSKMLFLQEKWIFPLLEKAYKEIKLKMGSSKPRNKRRKGWEVQNERNSLNKQFKMDIILQKVKRFL